MRKRKKRSWRKKAKEKLNENESEEKGSEEVERIQR